VSRIGRCQRGSLQFRLHCLVARLHTEI
jgi:hypothetical protein